MRLVDGGGTGQFGGPDGLVARLGGGRDNTKLCPWLLEAHDGDAFGRLFLLGDIV